MKTSDLTDRLQDWQKRIGDSAKTAASATDDYVRENTWTSIGIAALVGCIVGFLVGRGRD